MGSWFLGVSLARRSRLTTRYLGLAAGAILAAALCVLFGLLQFLSNAEERANARLFGVDSADGCIAGAFRGDVVGRMQYERIVVALDPRAGCVAAPAPPGLASFPEPGQVFVSPALQELREANPTIAERYPVVDGTIGPAGLIASNELRVVVGGDAMFRERTFNLIRFDRWGTSTDWINGYLRIDSSSLLGFGVLFFVPISIWLIYVGTLVNAKIRERQLGVLGVVGLDGRGVCRALVVEAAYVVGAGALVGLAASKLLLHVATPTFVGLRSFSGEYEPSLATMARVVAIVLAVTVSAAAAAATRSTFRPSPTDRHRRRGSALPIAALLIGIGTAVGALFSFGLRGMRTLIVGTEIVTFVGVVLITPVIASGVGRAFRASTAALNELVGARLRRPSGSLIRAVGALAGGLFIVSLAYTTIEAVVDDPQAIADQYATDGRSVLLVRYPNDAALELLASYDQLVGFDPAPGDPQVLSGTCEAVRAATGTTGACPRSGIYFTYLEPAAQRAVLDRLRFDATAQFPSGPRGDQFIEQVVKLTMTDQSVARPDTLYVTAPVEEVDALYNALIGADQEINVRVTGEENVTGTSELNSIADVFRWGGFFAVIAALIGTGIAVVALTNERRLASYYLEVLGLSRRRSAAMLVVELLSVSAAVSSLAAACAWLWGAEYAAGRGVGAPNLVGVITTFLYGLVAQAVICSLVVGPASRTARTAVIDGDQDMSPALNPFARRQAVRAH